MPNGRSPGSISAIYAGLDQSVALEARQRNSSSGDNQKLNQNALKNKQVKEEKVIPVFTRRRQEPNPADHEIQQLRKGGLEVPKELLDKKFAHNRARHSKDLKR